MPTRMLRVEKRLGSRYAKGDEVRVEVDDHGVPLDHFWRRRVRDAERDGCVTFLDKPTGSRRKRAESSGEGDG